jgi:Tol biopolymer transport system component
MAQDSSGYHIYVSNADGSAPRRLSDGYDEQPQWSPDGTHIAFTNADDSYHPQIFVMRADGSDRRALTRDGVYDSPSWSPDGKQLEFDSQDSVGRRVIVRMNADGSDARAVTSNGTAPAFSNSWSPVWKPAL